MGVRGKLSLLSLSFVGIAKKEEELNEDQKRNMILYVKLELIINYNYMYTCSQTFPYKCHHSVLFGCIYVLVS